MLQSKQIMYVMQFPNKVCPKKMIPFKINITHKLIKINGFQKHNVVCLSLLYLF